MPTITMGPKTGSCEIPAIISVPPRTMGATSTPSMRACGAWRAALASTRAKASRTDGPSARLSATPPASVLWAMSSEAIFSTTG